jgi:hypothetical protein
VYVQYDTGIELYEYFVCHIGNGVMTDKIKKIFLATGHQLTITPTNGRISLHRGSLGAL